LLRAPIALLSQKNDGRFSFLPQREKRSKVRICGNENSIFGPRTTEDCVVGGGLHSKFADMHGIVTGNPQLLREDWGQRIVHEKLHGTVNGNSRSLTASAA
jgi:hypothetical protein